MYYSTSQFLSHLLAGASVVLYDGIFDAQKVWNLVDECSISNFHIVPPMLYLLHRSIHQVKTTLETLRFICYSGGPSNYSIVLEFQKCMQGVSLIETYGMTEAGPRISSIFPNEKVQHPSSVGKPMNGVDVRIMDSSGNFWHSGEGELVVKSDSVMVGYYGEMTETSKVLRDGWLRTGDLCFLDEFGYIHLKGRVKAIINCGGNKFSPEFVESVLLQFPGVKEAFVYPQKHSVLGEVAEAQIVVESKIKAKALIPSNATEDEIKAIVLADEKIANEINGRNIKKFIIVPKRLINIIL